MRGAKQASQVTYHKAKGLFAKDVGRYVGSDGTTRYNRLWLGSDRRSAKHLAKFYLSAWQRLEEDNGHQAVGTDTAIAQVKEAIRKDDDVAILRIQMAQRTFAMLAAQGTPGTIASPAP